MDSLSASSRPSSTYSLSVLRMAQTLIWLCYSWEPPNYTAGLHHQVSSCRTGSWQPLSLPSSDLHQTVRQSKHHSSPGRNSASMMLTPRSYPGSYQSSRDGCRTLQPRSGPFQERFSRQLRSPIHMWLNERKWIHIKEAAMPCPQVPTNQAPAAAWMATKHLIFKIIQSAKTTEILCDTSFFLFILKFLQLVKLSYVTRFQFLKLVVSTSSVVWSQVRRFFILEYFCAINHGERIKSFRISSMFYCLNYYPVWYIAVYQSCTIVQCLS